MNDQRTLEHEIRSILSEHAPAAPPSYLLHSFEYNARRTRRLPRWLALLKEPIMRTDSSVTVGSPTARLVAIVMATMLLAAGVIGAGFAGARLLAADGPIVVAQDGSGQYTTIAEAVASAEDGDEIAVRPGTYVEAVVIDKDITVRGDGPVADIIIAAPEGGPIAYAGPAGNEPYAVLLSESSGQLSGLTFSGEPSKVIIDGGSPIVTGNVFVDIGYSFGERGMSFGGSSIAAVGGSAVLIMGNTVIDGGPIAAFTLATPVIRDNELRNGPHVFLNGTGAGTEVIDNTIEDAQINGIGAFGTYGNTTISGNTLSRIGENGLSLDLSTGVISGNTISETPYGIYADGQDLVVTGNTITGSEAGLQWHARLGTLEGNTVTDGRWGIVIASGAPLISGNTSCGNTANFVVGVPEELDEGLVTVPPEPQVVEGDNDFCEDVAG